MVTDETTNPAELEGPAPALDLWPGVVAAVLVLCLYGGLAASVDFSHVALGFQSDESTYYMMAHSLVEDGDLTYRSEDLARVWREFPAGPTGLFLKRGRDLDITVSSQFPYLHVASRPDPDQSRLYFGKSFAYPVIAAPFVWILGTSGFLVFHALLLTLVVFAGYLFLAARSRPAAAALVAASFVGASVAGSYLVWTTPEVMNFALVFLAYFFWLFKEVAAVGTLPRRLWFLTARGTDVTAAVLLAVASFSKPSNALLIVPIGAMLLWRRTTRHAVVCGAAFASVLVLLFAVNIAVTGDWNFQGGDRRTYVSAFPFLPGGADFNVGMDRTTNRVLTEIIFGPDFWTVLRHNLVYFFVGRYSGLVPYFFPAVFALALFAAAWRRRTAWQYLVLAVAVAEILLLIVWIPFNYFGGGGVLGNRYFMSVYGLFLFLLPPLGSIGLSLVPWIAGGLFTAQITLNAFYSAFHPSQHAMQGVLRLLPVELSLTNDLPINTSPDRVKVPFGDKIPFQLYFLDANTYHRNPPENGTFWVHGESTAECLVRGPEEAGRLVLTLTAGDRENRVTVRVAGRHRSVVMNPGQTTTFSLPLNDGFPYPGGRVWHLSITSRTGFVPMFTRGGVDNRFLGVQVKPEMMP